MNSLFQDLSHGILYFPVTQKFVDFVIFTCLRIFRNFLDLRNRKIWKCTDIWIYIEIWNGAQCLRNGSNRTLTM